MDTSDALGGRHWKPSHPHQMKNLYGLESEGSRCRIGISTVGGYLSVSEGPTQASARAGFASLVHFPMVALAVSKADTIDPDKVFPQDVGVIYASPRGCLIAYR